MNYSIAHCAIVRYILLRARPEHTSQRGCIGHWRVDLDLEAQLLLAFAVVTYRAIALSPLSLSLSLSLSLEP